MILELTLLKHILNYETYQKYSQYTDKERIKETHREVYNLYITLDEFFTKYPKTLSIDDLEIYFLGNRPMLKDKDKAIYTNLFEQLRNNHVDSSLIEEVILQKKQRAEAFALSELAYEVSQGKKNYTTLIEKVSKLDQVKTIETEDQFVTSDLGELYEQTAKQVGLRWRLNTLNRMLGSLRKGDFGFIVARPEAGKTTFLASEVSHFASQTNGPILWFSNEEQGNKVMLRIYQATLNLSLTELFSNLNKHKQEYYNLTKDNIKLYDSGNISKADVERLITQIKPDCIIFDQLDKIKGFTNDREDLRLGSIYIWARELAKAHCPVIGVTQSDASGEGRKWLDMGNVANAKTGKQAEADWILGIGQSHDDGMEYVRHFHLSKNKLQGDQDTDPNLRHGKQDVLIQPETARFKDIY